MVRRVSSTRSPRIVVLAMFVGLSGCSESPSGDGAPSDGSSSPTTGDGSTAGTVSVERLADAAPMALYFAANGTLQTTPPEAGSISVGTNVASFAGGLDPVDFISPALVNATLLPPQEVDATLFFRADAPLASDQLFDVALWFGSSLGSATWAATIHDDVIPSGTVFEVELTLSFDDRRGILVPVGESFAALLAASFTNDRANVDLLVGAEHPSRLDLQARVFNVDPLSGLAEPVATTTPGEFVTVTSPATCAGVPGTNQADLDVLVAATTRALYVEVIADPAPQNVDIDLALLDGDRYLTQASTPLGEEGAFLAEETLAGLQGKTLTVQVVACGSGRLGYDLVVTQTA